MNKITRTILEDLETVRESLLSLSDDIWLSIDHNDTAAMERGCQFKSIYNGKMMAFDSLSCEISDLVQDFTHVNLQSKESDGSVGDTENERLVRELRHDEPHSLFENFTFKRPHGFILKGTAITGVVTWKRLYTRFCESLYRLDPQRFQELPVNEEFISSHGNPMFSEERGNFHTSIPVGNLFANAHFSANGFRDAIVKLLREFEIDFSEFDIFLREDRDAGRSEAA